MLTTQQKFSGILTEVIRIAKDSSIDSTPAEHLQAAVEQMTLPIPVVDNMLCQPVCKNED